MANTVPQTYKGAKLAVAAVDFGTTYSGYAYSFYTDYKNDHLKIYANQAWNADGEGLITMKAPTIVLFDKNDEFHSFGFEAEKDYIELATNDQHKGWKYFRRFKMKLNERINLKKSMTLIDDQDQPKPALEVFSAAIKFLKDHLIALVQQSIPNREEIDFHWVLTVPAIWHDGARQFMEKSANLAGIPSDRLSIALEPECAAIYCKEVTLSEASNSTQSAELEIFNPGSQFMVIDLGGGTVDITTHEVDKDGNLKELTVPSGGPWGGTVVDKYFGEFLKQVFTGPVLQEFGQSYKEDELELYRVFELRKRAYKKKDQSIALHIPSTLFDVHSEKTKMDFKSAIERTNFAYTVKKKRDRLIIQSKEFEKLFQEAKYMVKDHLESLLRERQMRGVTTLLLVGGFAESQVMSDAIREAFPDKLVIVSLEAGLAVVKGAVMYGHNPDVIRSRKMPYTIGISTAVPFDDNVHPLHRKVVRNDIEKCEDVFKVFIQKGKEVVRDKTVVEHTFNCPFIGSGSAKIEIYRSSNLKPVYVYDEGCKRVADLELFVKDYGNYQVQTIVVEMMFDDTQIKVKAKEQGSKEWGVDAKVNFLL